MIDPIQYLKDGHKIIKQLIKARDFQRAYQGCQELLKIDPYNEVTIELLKMVEAKIMETNIGKIDKDIKSTWHLWDEGKYEQLLQIYTKLYAYAPQYEKLHELIQKAEGKLNAQGKNQRQQFIAQAIRAIKRVISEKRFGEGIQACNELLALDPLNNEGAQLLHEAQISLIEQKLHDNERIVDSGDYRKALELYESLLTIDPKNEKLRGLVADAHSHINAKNQLQQKIEINEGVSRAKELFEQQEYEKVVKACEDILKINPKNFTAHLYLQKARDTIEKEIDDVVLKKIKEGLPSLKEQYGRQKGVFVKI